MRIAFHSNNLGIRGAEVALYDYAYFNRELLGNESLIISSANSDLTTLPKFEKEFDVFLYKNFSEVENIIEDRRVDAVYFIKEGLFDGKIVRNTKNLVHAVFQTYQPHGEVYAYISEWLAKKMTGGVLPFVPHMINFPNHDADLREELGIPKNAVVFGRHGGEDQFNIPFVYEAVYEVANNNKNIYFLFVNTRRFCYETNNIIHIEPTYDVYRKVEFINTCDAMIHARMQGESFGLAIGEFLWRDKPVIASSIGVDRHHIDMLGDKGFYYSNSAELFYALKYFEKNREYGKYKSLVEQYSPKNVMEKFKKVFLK